MMQQPYVSIQMIYLAALSQSAKFVKVDTAMFDKALDIENYEKALLVGDLNLFSISIN